MVLPVPVAPVINPWRFPMPGRNSRSAPSLVLATMNVSLMSRWNSMQRFATLLAKATHACGLSVDSAIVTDRPSGGSRGGTLRELFGNDLDERLAIQHFPDFASKRIRGKRLVQEGGTALQGVLVD